ncbi:MAG TPA: N-acetylmuramoyl-L-alanine amidase [Clostridium perfringens]|nr:N-acetylmuramoyl-L-alanine amidase [uncultured Romboutsia sp.]HJF36598.1 N-acetylmuramoyl-L-alanine amidase [Clostridium perfringens]HLR33926.1 N-acetylmuramoyl-L-alanine amidase [Tissierellales bacterium]
MRCKKNIRNLMLLTMLISLPILSKTSIVNADSIEDEFLSVINKYDLKDVVVEPGIYLTKGETLDLSQYPNWELSDNETIDINSNGIAKAINEGTVFLSQRIGQKVYIIEIYVNSSVSTLNIRSKEDQPREYYKVFIDAGHGGSDPGALGFGYRESDLNLQIAKKIESKLKSRGIDVKMSRSSDIYYSLSERAEMANDYGADAFVSIHQNSAESASANGIETYYNRNKEEEKPLSNDVQTQVINKTGATNRGVKNAEFTVLVKSNMISALVECGFISNESEVKNLSDSDYQDKLATGIADGIENYLKSNVIIEESQITATGKVINTDSLNVRKGPSTSFDIIGTLSGGEKVKIVAKSNNWYKIEYNGTHGYVSASYIELDTTESEQDDKIKFNDVSQDYWAYSQIQSFVEKGYIDGYGDGTFRPQNPIKRNEFVKIFNKVFGLTKKSGIVFDDTKDNWAKDEIDIAVTNGVAQGVSSTLFEPDRYVTRQEAAKMLSNYMKLDDTNHDKIKKFSDYNQIAEWAKDALEGNVEKGYIQGTDGEILAPKDNMTRAEVVTLLSRVTN